MSVDSNLATAVAAGLTNTSTPGPLCSLANGVASADGSVQLYMNASGQWVPASGAAPALATLVDGANIPWAWTGTGATGGNIAQVTLGGNRTLAITGAQIGQKGTLKIIQDATGSRTLAITGCPHPTLTTTAAHVDVLDLTCVAANTFLCTMAKDVV